MCNSVRQKLGHTRPYSLLLNIAHSTTVQRNAELHLSNCHSKIKDCKAEESCTLPTICLTRSLEGKIQFSIWGKLHTKSGIQQSFLFKKIIAFILFFFAQHLVQISVDVWHFLLKRKLFRFVPIFCPPLQFIFSAFQRPISEIALK